MTNVFLNLYPCHYLAELLRDNRDRMVEFVNMLNALPVESVLQACRAYGGGLHKIEPKELLEVPLHAVPEWLGTGVTTQLLLV